MGLCRHNDGGSKIKPLITILTIFIVSLFVSHQPERCEHILIKGDAYGITQVWVTMCLAEQMQVDEDIQALLNECKDAREMCEAWRGLYYEIKKLKQTDKKCT